MRTYQEIKKDIDAATNIDDAETLRSLVQEMRSLGSPPAEAFALNALGTAVRIEGDEESALDLYHQAQTLFVQLGDHRGEAATISNIGNVYADAGDFQRALQQYRRALTLYSELGDDDGVSLAAGNMGSVFSDLGDYTSALEYVTKALALAEKLNEPVRIAYLIGNIGLIHAKTGTYASALEYLHRALALHEENGDRSRVATTTRNIGAVYNVTGDYPSALEHMRRALSLYEDLGHRVSLPSFINNIGAVFANTGDHASALEYYHRALALSEELGQRSMIALVTGNIGSTYANSGDNASALEYLRRAKSLYEDLGQHDSVALVTGNIIIALLSIGNDEEASSLLDQQASMQMDDPTVRAEHAGNRAKLAEQAGELHEAHRYLMNALEIVTEAGVRMRMAEFHKKVRDLAQKRNDFADYIHHNNEYNRISEEIRGKEATQRLAMMEAERRMDVERRERDKERALLFGALPESIATRMVRGERISGDHFDHAAVLFADVVGFTAHSADMDPSDVVMLLDKIFASFDALCEQHGVMKVKTIGDSYMCFKGDASAEENAHAIAQVAQQAMTLRFTWPSGEPLTLRIGLHIGPATAGVIGTQRLQYDVWGDTVNVASRMESTGEPGRIHASDAFAAALLQGPGSKVQEGPGSKVHDNDLVHGTWHLVLRGETAVKGKGMMATYWLEGA